MSNILSELFLLLPLRAIKKKLAFLTWFTFLFFIYFGVQSVNSYDATQINQRNEKLRKESMLIRNENHLAYSSDQFLESLRGLEFTFRNRDHSLK